MIDQRGQPVQVEHVVLHLPETLTPDLRQDLLHAQHAVLRLRLPLPREARDQIHDGVDPSPRAPRHDLREQLRVLELAHQRLARLHQRLDAELQRLAAAPCQDLQECPVQPPVQLRAPHPRDTVHRLGDLQQTLGREQAVLEHQVSLQRLRQPRQRARHVQPQIHRRPFDGGVGAVPTPPEGTPAARQDREAQGTQVEGQVAESGRRVRRGDGA